jgi:hypothetical protein
MGGKICAPLKGGPVENDFATIEKEFKSCAKALDQVSCDDYQGIINALKMLEKRKHVSVEIL